MIGRLLAPAALLAVLGASPALAEVGAGGPAASDLAPCPSKAEALAGVELPPQAPGCAAIVSFAAGVAAADGIRVVERGGASFRFTLDLVNAAAVRVPNTAALNALALDAEVADIVPDRRVTILAKPDKTGKPPKDDGGGGATPEDIVPSGIARIGADLVPFTGAGVGVAILDTGIDLDHPDLVDNVDQANCFFAAPRLTSCEDDHGHGTHVAGIVAAADNNTDVVGVAPQATLYAVKVLDQNGSGTDSEVLAGLQWVVDNHASLAVPITVVNMSLGGSGGCGGSFYETYTDTLATAGVTVVVAAGNDRDKEISELSPAGCRAVLAVASTATADGDNRCRFVSGDLIPDMASYFTTDGAGVAVSAPGEWRESINRGCIIRFDGILSDQLGGGTVRKAGTSMASPHVAGTVALMQEACGALDPEAVRTAIADNPTQGAAPFAHIAAATDDGVNEGVLDAVTAVDNCLPAS
jgi:subtilisin